MASSFKPAVPARTIRSAVGFGISACVHAGVLVLAPAAMEVQRGAFDGAVSLTIEERDRNAAARARSSRESDAVENRVRMARRWEPLTGGRARSREKPAAAERDGLANLSGVDREAPDSTPRSLQALRPVEWSGPPRPSAHSGPAPVDGALAEPESPPLLRAFTVPAPLLPREDGEISPGQRGGDTGGREDPSAVRGELGIPEPGSGQGSFDFYSPFDYEKEMKKARKKVAEGKMEYEMRKNTDRKHGVICNTGEGWFLCREKDLSACNRKHDHLCRYAEKGEAETLTRDRFF